MKRSRQTNKSVRVLVQSIENSKPTASKSFTVYETSLGEVFKVVNSAIEAQSEPAPKAPRKAKAKASKETPAEAPAAS